VKRWPLLSSAAVAWIVVLFGASGYLDAAGQQPSSPALQQPSPHRAVLDRYCVTCHNQRLKTAGLLLDTADVDNPQRDQETWEKVVRKLRGGAMPPAGLPRPDQSTYDALSTHLEAALDRAAEAAPNPGTPGIHRLNRTEYTNAIRDLLGLDVDASALLPADDVGEGFDNIAGNLTVSPVLVERYLSAAEKISRLAIGDTSLPAELATYNVPKFLWQDERMGDDLPFGSRGGLAISHYFPLDGDYIIDIRLQRNADDFIVGIESAKQLDIRVDGARVREFTVGGDPEQLKSAGKSLYTSRTADADLKVRLDVTAGPHLVQVAFTKDTVKPEGPFRQRVDRSASTFRGDLPDGVALVQIDGPYNVRGPGDTPSRRRIFGCRPDNGTTEERCARQILSTLARRAYRRPVTPADITPLLGLYRAGRAKGGFEAGVGMAVQGILVSPAFLFRVERAASRASAGAAVRLGPFELASRLSFFLWSSIPDDELLDLAERGRLTDSSVLQQQVRRMLQDSRSMALVRNFAGQWLYLRNLPTKLPDPLVYPEFDDNLKNALGQETYLFFDSIIREDRSVVDLIDADYTFVNGRLAEHYAIPNVYGTEFQRVRLTDENRRGLLGQGSILTVTSYATRTAPTLRGKWLLENLLGTPPPPPPPDVPSLKDDDTAQARTMRERMEEHRKNPVCASCHARMDPLGFALDNFDAIGKWRTTGGAANTPIDASGVLPDGTKFNGPAELRAILVRNREQFVDTFTEKLLTYALGRRVEYYDAPVIRKIRRDTAPDFRATAIILGIVQSRPFQFMRVAP
jgi:mono/diheme cytochrome c family protein